MKDLYPISLQQLIRRFLVTSNPNPTILLDDLILINNDIESVFSNNHNEPQTIIDSEITAELIKELSCQLYQVLIHSVSKLDVFRISRCEIEDLEIEENRLVKDEIKAHEVALSLSKTIATQFDSDDKERVRYFTYDWNESSIEEIKLLSQWIRACKNLIRWNRIFCMKIRCNSKSSNDKNNNMGVEQLAQWTVTTERLCSVGMVSLYLQILKFFIYKTIPCGDGDDVIGTLTLDDLARQCSTILFYTTYGQAPEPCCQKALRGFVSSLDGIRVIAKLLVTPKDCQCSVTTMLWLIKIVHNLVSSVNHALQDFESAFQQIFGPVKGIRGEEYEVNLYSVLVSTIGWSLLSSEPSFSLCGPDDKRPELVIEIIRVLFAKQSVERTKIWKKQLENEKDDMTKHMRMMVVRILQLPNQNRRFYECKLASLLLLMNDDASNYAELLVEHHVVDQLLTILWFQLNTLLIERAGEVHSERNATIVLPILIILNQLVSCNRVIWEKVKEYIFPASNESAFLQKVQMHKNEILEESHPDDETKKEKKKMHPLDAPVGTTRWKLIKLMTFTESNVKRCASELLWKICKEDPGEFVLRCGFGNAVHMLGIKGLYSIPKS